jgi:SPP1 gp7 family putative phage head morphogenesis protein
MVRRILRTRRNNHSAGEKKVARLLARLLAAQRRRLLEAIGLKQSGPIPGDGFWDAENTQMSGEVRQVLLLLATAAADVSLDELDVGAVDPAVVHQRILEWANQYAFNLVSGINETSRETIEEALRQFYEIEGMTRQDFVDMIAPAFGPARAEMIAITETTRAYNEAHRATIEEIEGTGLEMVNYWQTSRDELVCPICAPRHGLPEEEWETPDWPPLHPNCRCDVASSLA